MKVEIVADLFSVNELALLARDLAHDWMSRPELSVELSDYRRQDLMTLTQPAVGENALGDCEDGIHCALHMYTPPYTVRRCVNIGWFQGTSSNVDDAIVEQLSTLDTVITSCIADYVRCKSVLKGGRVVEWAGPVSNRWFSESGPVMSTIGITHDCDGRALVRKPLVYGWAGDPFDSAEFLRVVRGFGRVFQDDSSRILLLASAHDPKELLLQAFSRSNAGLPKNVVWLDRELLLDDCAAFMRMCDFVVVTNQWPGLQGMISRAVAVGASVLAPDYGKEGSAVCDAVEYLVPTYRDVAAGSWKKSPGATDGEVFCCREADWIEAFFRTKNALGEGSRLERSRRLALIRTALNTNTVLEQLISLGHRLSARCCRAV